jgi:hypothetical protein
MARRAHLTALLTASLLSAACTSWHRAGGAVEGVSKAKSGEIRVHRVDGSVIDLVGASIVGDSLFGVSPVTGARVSMPTAAVMATETKQVSAGRTALLGGGVVLGVIAVAGILVVVLILSTSWS